MMFEPSANFCKQLIRFGESIDNACIPTFQMDHEEMRELAGLLERWASGERGVRQEILDKFAVELEDDMVI